MERKRPSEHERPSIFGNPVRFVYVHPPIRLDIVLSHKKISALLFGTSSFQFLSSMCNSMETTVGPSNIQRLLSSPPSITRERERVKQTKTYPDNINPVALANSAPLRRLGAFT
jgi:hypothetical protein